MITVADTLGPVAAIDWLILNQGVVACSTVEYIQAEPTQERVIAIVAEERVIAVATDQVVVALVAVFGQADRPGSQPGGIDDVVTEQGIDGEFVGELCKDNVDLGGQAEDRDAGRVANHDNSIVAVSAIDDDGVDRAVGASA